MKPSTVRGTPVRSISGGNEGQMAGKPAGMSGAVNKSYEGDQSQKVNPRSGTPYISQNGNSATAKRVASSDKYGKVVDTATGEVMNDPFSNGVGVALGDIKRENDYFPSGAPAMDSPVPAGAATFRQGAMRAENVAHLGTGKGVNASQAGDVILEIGGVMSRGMAGTSTPSGAERELLEDDVLMNLGPGGAV